jgi:uncharacterized protein YqhQ
MGVIGGQAIIEGVMFRSSDKVVVSIRKPDGKIKVKNLKAKLFAKKFKNLFFIRGIFNLIEAVYVGVKAINYSAAESLDEKDKGKESNIVFVFTFLVAIIFALFIFKFLPYLFAGFVPIKSNVLFNVIEGITKFMIFILYIYFISKLKDMKVLFKYHGAEHKTINCYEAKKKLTLENVKKYSVLHKRCGTSFIILVVLISVLFYIFIPSSLGFGTKFLLRILLLPFIAGFAYEFLKFSAKYGFFSFPGMFVQKMTTSEPDDKQIEVAIKGLKELIT